MILNRKSIDFVNMGDSVEIDNMLFERIYLSMEECNDIEEPIRIYEEDNQFFEKKLLSPPEHFVVSDELKGYDYGPYSVALPYLEKVKDELERLEKEGIIEKSNSKFASPAFLVEKKNRARLGLFFTKKILPLNENKHDQFYN
ncbi:hypothetical protein NGRA_1293 [Nosema granulosis]|uniref:Reverse transcriptase n=1 Tax=Nosema granulosis TaxID=83296 RepID=A0A9P6GYR2_9MICR|nr:hypothetical protein NGRA_1293 [Nosema granulosis]